MSTIRAPTSKWTSMKIIVERRQKKKAETAQTIESTSTITKTTKTRNPWPTKPVIFQSNTSMFWFECIQNDSVGWNLIF